MDLKATFTSRFCESDVNRSLSLNSLFAFWLVRFVQWGNFHVVPHSLFQKFSVAELLEVNIGPVCLGSIHRDKKFHQRHVNDTKKKITCEFQLLFPSVQSHKNVFHVKRFCDLKFIRTNGFRPFEHLRTRIELG